ncbi:hypothetical protein EGI16_05020 [Chryseobacterium sp. G0240]|uniref:hypothetical protein n=1 Tax=Chryseobacterium sp. G0240 TaxID=2487066 RepID=UPI000F447D49|nr:hypothetical protein [Chryseobacterium sp. G0240]ROI05745.1 hypothetical protein EGI16_05020 [Chryseobacterium sp. G0240]
MSNNKNISSQSYKYDFILSELNNYLSNRFNYKKRFAQYSYGTRIIEARSIKFDIYLRLFDEERYKGKETLVIARLFYLREQRKGHGKDFLIFLTKLAIKTGFQYLSFENCNDNSKKFAEHFGFKQSIEFPHFYTIKVNDLSKRFDDLIAN